MSMNTNKAEFQIVDQLNFIRELIARFCDKREACPSLPLLEWDIQYVLILLNNGVDRTELKLFFEYICRDIALCIYRSKDIDVIVDELLFWNLIRKKTLACGIFYNLTRYPGYYFERAPLDYTNAKNNYINPTFDFSPRKNINISFCRVFGWDQVKRWFSLTTVYTYTGLPNECSLYYYGKIPLEFYLNIDKWKRFKFFLNGKEIIYHSYNKRFDQLRSELSSNKSRLLSFKILKNEVCVTYETIEGTLNIIFEEGQVSFSYGTYYAKRLVDQYIYEFYTGDIEEKYAGIVDHRRHYNVPFLSQNMRDGSLFIVTYPLIEAIIHTDLSVVKLLIETEYEDDSAFVNVENYYGQTPLYVACKLGKKDIVQYLISHGAKISLSYTDEQNKKEVNRLLHEAVKK